MNNSDRSYTSAGAAAAAGAASTNRLRLGVVFAANSAAAAKDDGLLKIAPIHAASAAAYAYAAVYTDTASITTEKFISFALQAFEAETGTKFETLGL